MLKSILRTCCVVVIGGGGFSAAHLLSVVYTVRPTIEIDNHLQRALAHDVIYESKTKRFRLSRNIAYSRVFYIALLRTGQFK